MMMMNSDSVARNKYELQELIYKRTDRKAISKSKYTDKPQNIPIYHIYNTDIRKTKKNELQEFVLTEPDLKHRASSKIN